MQYFNWLRKKTFVIREKFILNLWFQIQKRKRKAKCGLFWFIDYCKY